MFRIMLKLMPFFCLLLLISGRMRAGDLYFTLENTVNEPLKDILVEITNQELFSRAPELKNESVLVMIDGEQVPCQWYQNIQGDSILAILVDLDANAKRECVIRQGTSAPMTARVQAELSVKVGGHFENRKYIGGEFRNVKSLHVPPEHTDHSYYIRYEGPGWESDKVGYRFYLDWRNAVDVFGKRTDTLVLHKVGLDGFDSYHEMSDWGMDILKVGESLGIGSLAMWVQNHAQRVAKTDSVFCAVCCNGPVMAGIKTHYYGWQVDSQKYDLSALLTIHSGSRLTRCDVIIDPQPENLATGIVKNDSMLILASNIQNGQWNYLATYGKQSLAGDNLGLAVLYRKQDLLKVTEDEHSHVVVLRTEQNKLRYYFLAAWQGEKNGIKNAAEFKNYLEEVLMRLNHPPKIIFH